MSRIRANKITNQAANGAPIVEHGLVVSGILSATSVAIAGTITYEDVTSIDSVGIITARSTFDAQGDVLISDKIVHKSDTNTAIRFPTNDNITFETGGTERLRIDSSGRVSIGLSAYVNTTPSEYDAAANTLIVGTGSGDEGITILSGQSVGNYGSIFFADGSGAINSKRGQLRYEQNNEVMSFYTAGAEKVRITSGGNFGIGTNDPQTLLHLSSSNPLIRLTDTDNNAYSAIGGESGHLYLYTNSTGRDFIFRGTGEVARLTGDGLLGIGTNNPTATLEINNGSPKIVLRDSDNGANISIHNVGGAAVYSSAGDAVFQTVDTTERFRITSDGKFGFGTSSLTENTIAEFTRDVGGGALGASITVRNSSTNSVNNVAELRLKTNHGIARFYKYNTGSTVIQSHTSGASDLLLYADGASNLRLHTNGTERLRIDSTGKLAVGTNTPFTYAIATFESTNGIVLQGSSQSRLLFRHTGGGTDLKLMDIQSSNGVMKFRTLDDNTTATDRMVINSNGYVGINEANPSAQLHVENDNANASSYYLNADATVLIQNKNSNASAKTVLKLEGPVGGGDCAIVYGDSSANLIFSDRQNERMRISSTGYVSGNINVPAWFGKQDTAHNVATASWTTVVNLGNEVTNPSFNNGSWNESTGTFTVGAGQAGTYYVFGACGIDDIQSDDVVRVGISKNNATPSFFGEQRAHSGEANQIYQANVAMVITVAETDTIRLKVYHNEGSTEPTEPNRTYFGGYRLSV